MLDKYGTYLLHLTNLKISFPCTAQQKVRSKVKQMNLSSRYTFHSHKALNIHPFVNGRNAGAMLEALTARINAINLEKNNGSCFVIA